jgi:hypothetical protein
MELVNDESYTNYCVKVFQLNLLRGLKKCTPVKVLKFRIRCPIIPILEGIS